MVAFASAFASDSTFASDPAFVGAAHGRELLGSFWRDGSDASAVRLSYGNIKCKAFALCASYFCLGKRNQNRFRRDASRRGGAASVPCAPRLAWHGAQTRFAQTRAPLRPRHPAVLGSLYGSVGRKSNSNSTPPQSSPALRAREEAWSNSNININVRLDKAWRLLACSEIDLDFAFDLPLSGPVSAGDGGGRIPEGRRARRAPFFEGTWMCLRKMPGPSANPQRAARRAARSGVLSFGYFSLHKQRKVTRAKARNAFEQEQSHWISAFAGMTTVLVAKA